MVLAVALPPLLAINFPPSSTFLNQAAALVGWSLALLLLAPALQARHRPDAGAAALLGALALSALACIASMLWRGLPAPLGLSALGLIAAAAFAAVAGAALAADDAVDAFGAFSRALLLGGAASVVIAAVQVFAPGFADGTFIAAPAHPGRASGNLRQPNHLSTLLLWAVIAAAWLAETGVLRRVATFAIVAALTFALVLTASRTGLVGIVLLAAWGLLDRRLARAQRLLLLATPLLYAFFWLGATAWAAGRPEAFAGEARLSAEGDISSSRLAIWSDTLGLVARYPWSGVGFGEFNFAWTLTPFPQRPLAFFDHTHNLPLHLVVEMGIPLGGGVFMLLLVALWRAFVRSRGPVQPLPAMRRAAFMLVLTVGLHSLLEYPLWYAYFLLPTAFAFGLCFGPATAAPQSPPEPRDRRFAIAAGVAAAAMLLLSLAALEDYRRVASIFSPRGDGSLEERIAAGQRSRLFAHHAHYAAATTAEHPSESMESFDIATHFLLDTRLMMAWATALAEAGDLQRARHLAARLREFRHPDAEPFFAPCEAPRTPGAARPFQCTPPATPLDHREFR
jgi:O-antigen ligase